MISISWKYYIFYLVLYMIHLSKIYLNLLTFVLITFHLELLKITVYFVFAKENKETISKQHTFVKQQKISLK